MVSIRKKFEKYKHLMYCDENVVFEGMNNYWTGEIGRTGRIGRRNKLNWPMK